MKAIWDHTKGSYEIEMYASEQGTILAALDIAGQVTGDPDFTNAYKNFKDALNNAEEKE